MTFGLEPFANHSQLQLVLKNKATQEAFTNVGKILS